MQAKSRPTAVADIVPSVIHKEKNQKKNNKATGQVDKLFRVAQPDNTDNSNPTTDDKQIRREANYLKNIHIDKCYQQLKDAELITDDRYRAFWCGAIHKLGANFVMAQADLALKGGRKPAALFHFLINKALNAKSDPYMPRIR